MPMLMVNRIRAHFLLPQKTGLSACIFCPVNRPKGYRFYPLREPKPLCGFGFAEFHCVKLPRLWGVWGKVPNSENQKPTGFLVRPPCRLRFWFLLLSRSYFASLTSERMPKKCGEGRHRHTCRGGKRPPQGGSLAPGQDPQKILPASFRSQGGG
jgi:hypothetical protein